jgi:hypothetical protein
MLENAKWVYLQQYYCLRTSIVCVCEPNLEELDIQEST